MRKLLSGEESPRALTLRFARHVVGSGVLMGAALWLEPQLTRAARFASDASARFPNDAARASESMLWNALSLVAQLAVLAVPLFMVGLVVAFSVGLQRSVGRVNPARGALLRRSAVVVVTIGVLAAGAYVLPRLIGSRATTLELESLAREKHPNAAEHILAALQKLEGHPVLYGLVTDELRSGTDAPKVIGRISRAYATPSALRDYVAGRAALFAASAPKATAEDCVSDEAAYRQTLALLDAIKIPVQVTTLDANDPRLVALRERLRALPAGTGDECKKGHAVLSEIATSEVGTDFVRERDAKELRDLLQLKETLCRTLTLPDEECALASYRLP